MKSFPGISHTDPHIAREAIAANRAKSAGREHVPSKHYSEYLKEHEQPHWGKGGKSNPEGHVK